MVRTLRTVNPNLSDNMRGLLDTIAGTESPSYNTMYGGSTFGDYSSHPNIAHTIMNGVNAGQKSTAAGRYQMLTGTALQQAKELGTYNPQTGAIPYSPEQQDAYAANLAKNAYSNQTGRDLEVDLSNPSQFGNIGRALSGTWTSLPGGIEATTNAARFGAQLAPNIRNYTDRTYVATADPTTLSANSVAADSGQRFSDRQAAIDAAHPSLISSLTSPFSSAFNAVGNMFGGQQTTPAPQHLAAAIPSPTESLNPAPTLGTITSRALAALPSQMPARVASQTPLIVGTQVADTPPATAPSYAEGTLGHLLSRPQSSVMASMAPSMPMTRVTAMPPSTPAFAPTPQQQSSLPASAFAPTAPQTAPQAPQQQTGQWVSDLKAMDADESARRTAALTSPVTAPAAFSMPSRPISPTPTAPTPSLQAPSMSPSAAPSIPQGVNAMQSLASGMPSLSTMGQYAGLALGSPLAGAMPAVSTMGALAAPVAGALTAPQGPVNSSVIGAPTVPGTNLPVGDPVNPVNGPPVAPPSTLSKITPTLGDIKTGLVGAKIGMGAGPIGAAAGFAIPVLGGIANRLGYGLNSPFFGGPTPNPGASPATQSDVVAHAAPSVLAQVNRMGYGALPAGSDYHYGYSPFGSGISLVNNNDTEAHQIAATGPGLLGALGFGGPASAPSLAAQAAAARTAAANDAANTAAAANASQGTNNGNGNNPSSMNKGFGNSTNSNGRNGRNKNDNGNN